MYGISIIIKIIAMFYTNDFIFDKDNGLNWDEGIMKFFS